MTGNDRERQHERDTQDHLARERLIQRLLQENRQLRAALDAAEHAAARWTEQRTTGQLTPADDQAFTTAIQDLQRAQRRHDQTERRLAA